MKPNSFLFYLSKAMLMMSLLTSSCVFGSDAPLPEGSPEGPNSNADWEERGEVWLTLDPEQSPLEIITQAFDVWLAQYTHELAPENVALLDYTIDSIEAVSDPFFAGDYDFVFTVEYSVRPRSGSNRWQAGDGRQGTGGWVVDKSHYVGVMIMGEDVWVLIQGPCPMC